MRSRWNDAEAAALSGVDLLVYASRLVGAETSLVVWGGGNTSIKTRERDHRGREIPVLRVKGSGSDLKSIQKKDFPGVRMDDIRALLERQDMSDEEMVAYLAHGLLEVGGVRPSIETLLHGFVDAPVVIHTHADAIVSLTNNDRAADVCVPRCPACGAMSTSSQRARGSLSPPPPWGSGLGFFFLMTRRPPRSTPSGCRASSPSTTRAIPPARGRRSSARSRASGAT